MSVGRHLAVGLALLAGFGLRVYQLGTQGVWADEIYSVWYSQMDWPEIIRFNIRMQDPHAPLFYFLLKAAVLLLGSSEFAYRFVPLLAGVVSVALVFALGRKLGGFGLGVSAALVLAVNPFHVWYAQETRTYTLTTALTLLSLLLFVRIVGRQAGRGTWAGYIVASTLLIYSHYYGFLILLLENVLFLLAWLVRVVSRQRPVGSSPLRPRGERGGNCPLPTDHSPLVPVDSSRLEGSRRPPLRSWLLAQAAFVVPYLPFADHGVRMLVSYRGDDQPPIPLRFVERSVASYSLGWFLEAEVVRWLIPGFLALAALGLLGLIRSVLQQGPAGLANADGEPRTSDRTAGQGHLAGGWAAPVPPDSHLLSARAGEQLAFLLGFILIPVGGAIAVFQLTGRSLLQERYFILITPAYYLLIAAGITRLGRLWPPLAVAALLFVSASSLLALHPYYTDPRHARYDLRGLSQYIARHERPGDGVAVMGELVESVFTHYYRGALPVYQIRSRPAEGIPDELGLIAPTYRRLWLVPYADTVGDRMAESWLSRYGYRIEGRWFKTARLRLYSLPSGPPEVVRSPGTPWEGGATLAGVSLARGAVEAGDAIEVRLFWQGARLDDDYRVVVRLLDPEGFALAHSDRPLGAEGWWDETAGAIAMNAVVVAPFGTPPGTYQLAASLQRADGRGLAYLDDRGTRRGTLAPLGPVEVRRPAVPPPLEAVDIPRRLDVPVGPGLRLVGYGLPDATLRAGQPLRAVLYWQAVAGERGALDIVGQIVDPAGRVVGEQRETTTMRKHPPAAWSLGEVVRDGFDLPTGRAPSAGEYQVRLGVRNGSQWLTLGSVRLTSRERHFAAPPITRPVGARFTDLAELLGYDLSLPWEGSRAVLAPGQPFVATLHWRAIAPTDVNYTVFVQILDAEGRLVAQHDGMPGRGEILTTTWLEGEVVSDPHEIVVPAALPAGDYRLIAGLYDARTGRRLPLDDGSDHLTLATMSRQ